MAGGGCRNGRSVDSLQVAEKAAAECLNEAAAEGDQGRMMEWIKVLRAIGAQLEPWRARKREHQAAVRARRRAKREREREREHAKRERDVERVEIPVADPGLLALRREAAEAEGGCPSPRDDCGISPI